MVADCWGDAWQGNQSYYAPNVCKGMVCATHLLLHSQIEGYRVAACSVVGYARLMAGVLYCAVLCCAVLQGAVRAADPCQPAAAPAAAAAGKGTEAGHVWSTRKAEEDSGPENVS